MANRDEQILEVRCKFFAKRMHGQKSHDMFPEALNTLVNEYKALKREFERAMGIHWESFKSQQMNSKQDYKHRSLWA